MCCGWGAESDEDGAGLLGGMRPGRGTGNTFVLTDGDTDVVVVVGGVSTGDWACCWEGGRGAERAGLVPVDCDRDKP